MIKLQPAASIYQFDFDIVGESHHQDTLELIDEYVDEDEDEDEIDDNLYAILTPEDDNPHDENAVKVEIFKRLVGHLSRTDALTYRKHLGKKVGVCHAIITGGHDSGETENTYYGVKLNLTWPPKPES